jgi:uncharacterized protein YcfL
MKIKTLICVAVTAGLLAGCVSEKAEKHAHRQAKLMVEAKVSKDDAEKIALSKSQTALSRKVS